MSPPPISTANTFDPPNAASKETVTPDWLRTSPTPLTVALLRVGPLVRIVRTVLEGASWKGSWYTSWTYVSLWWAICLGARVSFVGALALAFIFLSSSSPTNLHTTDHISKSASEATVQRSVDDILAVSALLPRPPHPSALPRLTVRASVIIYLVWLLLGIVAPGRIILGVSGTVVLCIRAPWFRYMCGTVWRSAWVRWAVYRTWNRMSGIPIVEANTLSITSSMEDEEDRFLFTLYENQRWWMGLDWTAALLPNERPSWCTTTLIPVQPPAAFTLPAGWRWEEKEWSVVVKTDENTRERVVKEMPSEDEGILAKAAGRVREGRGQVEHERTSSMDAKDKESDTEGDDDDNEPLTDVDGWIYGDNKWEARGPKGGIGKYTRYRRWTRIALVSSPSSSDISVTPPAVTSPALEALKEIEVKSSPPSSVKSKDTSPSRIADRFIGALGKY